MRRIWNRVLLVAALAALGSVGAAIPRGPVAVAAAPAGVVRVLTFNVCGGYQEDCRPTEEMEIWAARVAGQVTAWDSDVVAFQEMCDGQRKLLEGLLTGYEAVWWPGRKAHTGCGKWYHGPVGNQDFGDAVFVRRGSLRAQYNGALTSLWDQSRTKEAGDTTQENVLCAGAVVDSRESLVCTVHLHRGIADHGIPETVARLQSFANGRPVILAGDFNADPQDPGMDPFYAGASGTGAFREVDDADRTYFTANCRHRTTCRTGETTTYPRPLETPPKEPRKFDYIFGSADQLRWLGGGTVEPGFTFLDHKILRGEAVWAADATAPATPVAEPAGVRREPGTNVWTGAFDLVAGRFTADTVDDLVVRWWNGAVDLYPGRADGTLDPPRVIRSTRDGGWSDATDIAAGDFDGDGWDDLAVRWSRNSLFVYDGKGGLENREAVLGVGKLDGVAEMVAGHVDGDPAGKRDSVVIRRTDGSLAAFKVTGDHAEPTVELLPEKALDDARHIALGDAYGPARGVTDGRDDLFLRLNSGSLYAFAGTTSGFASDNWEHIHSAQPEGKNPITATLLGDFDGDGHDDLVVRNRRQYEDKKGNPADDGRLHRFVLTGDAVTEREPLAPAVLGWSDVAHFVIGAFTGTGASDELRRWSSGSVTPLKATDAQGRPVDISWTGVRDAAVADLAGDARDDVVLRLDNGTVSVVPAPFRSEATSSPPGLAVTPPTGGWCPGSVLAEVAAGDVVADGRDDLVVRCGSGVVLAYPVSTALAAGSPVTVRAAGDLGTIGMYVDRIDGRRTVVLRTADGATTAAAEAEPGRFAAPRALHPAGTWADATDVVRDDATGSLYGLWTDGEVTRYLAGAVPASGATVTVRSFDEGEVDHFRYAVDGSPAVDDAGWVDAHQSRGVITLTGVAPGPHTVRVIAVDRAGNNSGELSHQVTIPALPTS